MAIYIDKDANPELRRKVDLQRMSVFIESKRELNNRLMELPGGNLEKIGELNKKFDEIIEDELSRLESGRPLRQLARRQKRGRDGAGAACKETKMG